MTRCLSLVLACLFVIPLSLGQITYKNGRPPTANPELSLQLTVLKAKVERLEKELQRMAGLEARLKAVESRLQGPQPRRRKVPLATAASSYDLPSHISPWSDMPYEDSEAVPLVVSVKSEGRTLAGGGSEFDLTAEVVMVPRRDLATAKQVSDSGNLRHQFAGPLPRNARRHLVVIENLPPEDARFWKTALSPTLGTPNKSRRALAQILFPRVSTSETHRHGYKGNAGSVRSHRGKTYWHQNSVFFVERGMLRVLGPVTARFHIGFARAL